MEKRKEATTFTRTINRAVLDELNWEDTAAYEQASRGFIAAADDLVIRNDAGSPTYDLGAYPFLEAETAPPSVNPSLWRQSRLLALYHGLFQVTEGIYQIRSFDLAVMSIIESDSGYVIVDPLTVPSTSRAGMELVYKHLGRKPMVAVIYTHSHIDHWGGVKGVIDDVDVREGRVKVIAPEHFLEHAISENVIAGM